MEMIDNPLHEAAKRGNIMFMNECIANRVCYHFLISNIVCFSTVTLSDMTEVVSRITTSNVQRIFIDRTLQSGFTITDTFSVRSQIKMKNSLILQLIQTIDNSLV